MAKVTLGMGPDTREEKTTEELQKLIADALNEADKTRALTPADIAIVTQHGSNGSWSYGVKEATDKPSQMQNFADQRVIEELNKKYKTSV